eukprot:CAMPEP_0170542772 /NCGR_PEP_ID=MMETSP0211-20121228/2108_1 /TAXON_ID=311385 /ORGANISM="Pseudokeronopsis sp., Strain OXSARD2" /LENGTH=537 /DNA_ID=CAMNT_0010845959 /DNA_START=1287 /DNA_END=2900 /DNA_ORIENTATION=+
MGEGVHRFHAAVGVLFADEVDDLLVVTLLNDPIDALLLLAQQLIILPERQSHRLEIVVGVGVGEGVGDDADGGGGLPQDRHRGARVLLGAQILQHFLLPVEALATAGVRLFEGLCGHFHHFDLFSASHLLPGDVFASAAPGRHLEALEPALQAVPGHLFHQGPTALLDPVLLVLMTQPARLGLLLVRKGQRRRVEALAEFQILNVVFGALQALEPDLLVGRLGRRLLPHLLRRAPLTQHLRDLHRTLLLVLAVELGDGLEVVHLDALEPAAVHGRLLQVELILLHDLVLLALLRQLLLHDPPHLAPNIFCDCFVLFLDGLTPSDVFLQIKFLFDHFLGLRVAKDLVLRGAEVKEDFGDVLAVFAGLYVLQVVLFGGLVEAAGLLLLHRRVLHRRVEQKHRRLRRQQRQRVVLFRLRNLPHQLNVVGELGDMVGLVLEGHEGAQVLGERVHRPHRVHHGLPQSATMVIRVLPQAKPDGVGVVDVDLSVEGEAALPLLLLLNLKVGAAEARLDQRAPPQRPFLDPCPVNVLAVGMRFEL